MDHLHQVYDIEYSQPGGCLNIRPVRRHVGAFEDHGADLGVLGTEPLRHPDMLSTRSFDVEGHLIAEQDAGEFSLSLHASDGDGMSDVMPAPSKSAGVSDEASTVIIPTAFPGGSMRCTIGTSIRLEVNTGTVTAAAISRWNLARKPQLVVMACTPSVPGISRRR